MSEAFFILGIFRLDLKFSHNLIPAFLQSPKARLNLEDFL